MDAVKVAICAEPSAINKSAVCVKPTGHDGNHEMRQAKCVGLIPISPRHPVASLSCGQRARFLFRGDLLCGTHANQHVRQYVRARRYAETDSRVEAKGSSGH